MTAAEAIARADALRPNEAGTDLKYAWLNEAEAEVIRHINRHEGRQLEPISYTAETGSTQLVLDGEWDGLYVYKLMAEMDMANGEMDRYNNDAARFNQTMQEWKNAYRREHKPWQDHRRGWKLI